jgi:enamine deaminase RidA (YjgF/YER057c/UK114 family)
MPTITDKLTELGLELPQPFAAPQGLEFKFDLVHVLEDMAFISGHLPMDGTEVLVTGRVGDELDVDAGYEAARLVGLSIFASLQQELGDLDRVKSWVKVLGMVQCGADFDKPPAVINGFTDLVLEVWGDPAGRHARSAIGVETLPFNAPVEIEGVVQIHT